MAAEYQVMEEDEPREEYVFVEEYFPLDLHEEEVVAEPLDAQEIIVQTGDHQEIVRAVTIHREDGTNIKQEVITANIVAEGYDDADPNSWTTQEEVIIESSDNVPQSAIIKLESEEESQTHVYECYKCAKRFNYKDKLFKHMKLHHARGDDIMIERDGKRIWTCTQCDKTFISRKGSIIHQRTHTGERPYSCSVCHKRFIDSSTLMKHQVIHQAVRPFTCLICRRGFNQKVALQRHERTHGQIQPNFKCKFCPKTFLVGSSLQAHEKIHSGIKPYTCQYCPSRFHTSTAQRQHERVHTNERPYACSYCPKAFKDSGTLFKHQVIHSGIRPFVCPICSQGFTQKVALRKHIRSHVSRNQDNICEVCDTQFFSKDDLCSHVEDHIEQHPSISQKHKQQELLVAETADEPSSPKPDRTTSDLSDLATLCDVAISTAGDLAQNFPCHHCGMTFRRKKSLDSHLAIHRMNCKQCNRVFVDRTALDNHEKKCTSKVLIHTKPKQVSEVDLVGATVIATGDGNTTIIDNIGDGGGGKDLISGGKNPKRYFYCERCDKTFSSRNGYIIHQRSHTGERPYPCRWCDKAFGDSATRHKHERIHTGERPFKCHRCPRAFNQRAALRAHQVTHTVDRAFLCKYCPSSFPYFATLKRHQQSCHASIPCPLCSASSPDARKLHLHIKNIHATEGNLSCSLCDSGIFTDPTEYCDHMVWHGKQQQGEPKSTEDSEAEKETQIEIIEPEGLIKQEVIEEEEIITEEVYTTEETYEVHEEASFIEEGYSEEVYTQEVEQTEEVIEQTVVTDDFPIVEGGYSCDVCGLMFPEKEALQEHVPLHF